MPGTPDLLLPKYRLCLFVNGCFWHRHQNCHRATFPATNQPFWAKKFDRTLKRDQKVIEELSWLGWRTLVIWECEARNPTIIVGKLKAFLRASKTPKGAK